MSRLIALDIETYDPRLKELGDGAIRKDGRVLCCGAHGDGISKVFDFDSHNDVQELSDILADKSIDKVFHNGIYDLSWLACGYDFPVEGRLHDTMTRASLIDEYQSLGLNDCCIRLGIQGKNKSQTIEVWYETWQQNMKLAAGSLKKGLATDDGKIYIPSLDQTWKLSGAELEALVTDKYKKDVWANILILWDDPTGRQKIKDYNLQDCIATYNLFRAQEKFMAPLQQVYDLECKLIPILIKMKKKGIRVDKERMVTLTDEVQEACNKSEQVLIDMFGITGDMVASSKALGARLNEMGIVSPVTTKTGAQSWAEDALSRIHHPVIGMIQEYKSYASLLNKYLRGSLASSLVGDRIHCTFYPTLREDAGTVTGRFSCKNPNLQQIPSRNKAHGQDFSRDMRTLFLPEEGRMLAALDYAQIEALLLGHFAQGQQAEWFREQLRNGVDLHTIAMDLTGITYRPVVKTFNYGCIYGMGWYTAMTKNYTLFEKLAKQEGKDVETFTKEIYNNYHHKFPVIKDTMNWCQNIAKAQGYIDTMGGRRLHKPKAAYDPATCKINDYMYKMLNKLIQGTAADILKTAIVEADEKGLYDVLDLHLLVHDEQVVSAPFNREGTEAVVELQQTMAGVFKEQLLVPIHSSCELGPNWGYWSDDIYEEMQKGNFDEAFLTKAYQEAD